jgi:prepilin-type N-terminal cleavage/methylation domain-containing protein
MKRKQTGFTLIELLIVVAIIAILAAIAIPNFLQAQVRSKVARSKAELRTLTSATQAYCVDYNEYPRSSGWYGSSVPGDTVPDKLGTAEAWFFLAGSYLTTPIAFISSYPNDSFNGPPSRPYAYYAEPRNNIIASTGGAMWFKYYSVGPDGYWNRSFTPVLPSLLYDPTNGTVSNGDIARLGGETGWYTGDNKD